MNLIKDIAKNILPQVLENDFIPISKRKRIAQGLCLTCNNRKHCIWQENRKQFCEHFE